MLYYRMNTHWVNVHGYDPTGQPLRSRPVKLVLNNDNKVSMGSLEKWFGPYLRYQEPDGIAIDSDGAGYSNVQFPPNSDVKVYSEEATTSTSNPFFRWHDILLGFHNTAQRKCGALCHCTYYLRTIISSCLTIGIAGDQEKKKI